MKSEKQKMIDGEFYSAFVPELTADRARARELTYEYNNLHPSQTQERERVMRTLLGSVGKAFVIEPDFRCDYGYNIRVGENFYANFGCVILDCAPVTIGKNVMFAPNVGIYTATHPVDAQMRISGVEYALPITIGDNVWLGGNVIVLPGVTIGDNTTIGAGSVVTRDIPEGVVAVGNPCRVIKKIQKNGKG